MDLKSAIDSIGDPEQRSFRRREIAAYMQDTGHTSFASFVSYLPPVALEKIRIAEAEHFSAPLSDAFVAIRRAVVAKVHGSAFGPAGAPLLPDFRNRSVQLVSPVGRLDALPLFYEGTCPITRAPLFTFNNEELTLDSRGVIGPSHMPQSIEPQPHDLLDYPDAQPIKVAFAVTQDEELLNRALAHAKQVWSRVPELRSGLTLPPILNYKGNPKLAAAYLRMNNIATFEADEQMGEAGVWEKKAGREGGFFIPCQGTLDEAELIAVACKRIQASARSVQAEDTTSTKIAVRGSGRVAPLLPSEDTGKKRR